MTDVEAKFISVAEVRSWHHDQSQNYPKTSGVGEVQHPGTMNMCCQCARHRPGFSYSKHGRDFWYYCDLWVEALEIVKPVALVAPDGKTLETCHWHTPGRNTRRTPETDGRKQVLNPDWDGPPT